MKRILAITLSLIMALSCFAACGNQQEAVERLERQVEDLEDQLDEINKNKHNTPVKEESKQPEAPRNIVVGYTLYAPMNYMEGEQLVGFDTDLAKAVFEGLGYKVIFQEIQWENKYANLNAGIIDCIWNGFTCNTADDDGIMRSEKVDFSYNYMTVEGFYGDAEYYAVGFKKGSPLTAEVNKQLEKLAADGILDEIAEKYDLSNCVITDFSGQK